MSFSEKFMKLPQKLRMAIVGIVLVVVAVPVLGLLIVLKNVLPEGKASAAPATTAVSAAKTPEKTPAKPAPTAAKKK
ncbi:MAG: hypothetical protein HOV80_06840 [Polyangiaceae bacterium]|nr:hypothetical protein [Polyangiaceae bacterium]